MGGHSIACVRTVEYYAAMNKSEALTQAASRRHLESLQLPERNQMQKDTWCRRLLQKTAPKQAKA